MKRPKSLQPALPARTRRGHRHRIPAERGFTLIELTVVVILVGVFAAMAMPQVTYQLRDRRVHEAAQRISLIYQQARIRAMGQGGAILVHYDTSGTGRGLFTTMEALVGGNGTNGCQLGPTSSCTLANWAANGTNQNRTIESVDFGRVAGLGDVYASLTDTTNAAATTMDLCFTPLGRTFVRYSSAPGTPFTPMTGVPQFSVFHGTGLTSPDGRVRRVLVLPSGMSRLQL